VKRNERADILLVHPIFQRAFGPAPMSVPLGLSYMAAGLRRAGFTAEICNLDFHERKPSRARSEPNTATETRWPIDDAFFDAARARVLNPDAAWRRDFTAALKIFSPKVIGIGMVTPQYDAALAAARVARETLPDARVVAGGIHPTVIPEETLATGLFDTVAVGECDSTVIALARHYASCGGAPAGIAGVCYIKNGRMVRTAPAAPVKDLDSLEFPARDCIAPPAARRTASQYSATILTGRGCPFNCTYCARAALWPRENVRFRSPDNVIEELKQLKRDLEICYFYVLDDTFNIMRERTLAICDALASRRLGLNWQCKARADSVDDSLASALLRAGCDSVYLGAESGSQVILDKMKKNITVDQVARAAESLKRHGIRAVCSFILGHPDETPDTLGRTELLIRNLGAERNAVFFMVPYPGSELFDTLKAEGRIATFDWFRYVMFNPSLIRRDGVTDAALAERMAALHNSLPHDDAAERRRRLSPSFILRKLRTVRSPARLAHLATKFLAALTDKDL